jgi:hypothetical protein
MIATYGRAAILYPICFLTVWAGHATSSTVPSTIATAEPLHAAISDPVGDAEADPRIAVSPDLASATADVAAGNITFVIQFAPGTADRSTTWVRVELDTDMNSATGNRERNGMGSDYTLLILANGTRASVQKLGYTAGGRAHALSGKDRGGCRHRIARRLGFDAERQSPSGSHLSRRGAQNGIQPWLGVVSVTSFPHRWKLAAS